MKKKLVLLVAFFLISTLFACGHKHVWADPTCTTPKTCIKCGRTIGEALGHTWVEATCTFPKTCSVCGETEGEALGHTWVEATCTSPKVCLVCGETEGEALGHTWIEATCTSPKACSVCGETEGEALEHTWIEATCTSPKTCSVCGGTEGEPLGHDAPSLSCINSASCVRCGEVIPALGHDWIDATCVSPKTCTRCGITEGRALGHSPAKAVREKKKMATCTKEGSYDEVVYCSACHEELSRKTVKEPALGHTTSNGICSRCKLEIYETITGKGADVVSNIRVGNGIYRVHFVHKGRSNFIVHSYDADDDIEYLVNEIGDYDGWVLLSGKSPFMFEVESRGEWSISIERIPTTNSKSFSGKGDYVTDIANISSGIYEFTHDGKDNFIVHIITNKGTDYLVNVIGEYSGKKVVKIPSGSNALFEITADGNWTIKKVG